MQSWALMQPWPCNRTYQSVDQCCREKVLEALPEGLYMIVDSRRVKSWQELANIQVGKYVLTMHVQQWLCLSDVLIGKLMGMITYSHRAHTEVCLQLLHVTAPCTAWQMQTKRKHCSTAQHSTAQHSTAQHNTVKYIAARHSTTYNEAAQHSRCSCLPGFIYHNMCELQGPWTAGVVSSWALTSPLVEGAIVPFPQHACMAKGQCELVQAHMSTYIMTWLQNRTIFWQQYLWMATVVCRLCCTVEALGLRHTDDNSALRSLLLLVSVDIQSDSYRSDRQLSWFSITPGTYQMTHQTDAPDGYTVTSHSYIL